MIQTGQERPSRMTQRCTRREPAQNFWIFACLHVEKSLARANCSEADEIKTRRGPCPQLNCIIISSQSHTSKSWSAVKCAITALFACPKILDIESTDLRAPSQSRIKISRGPFPGFVSWHQNRIMLRAADSLAFASRDAIQDSFDNCE